MTWKRYLTLLLWALSIDAALYESWVLMAWQVGRLTHPHVAGRIDGRRDRHPWLYPPYPVH